MPGFKYHHDKLDFSGKKILVVGLGVSGFCSARWLAGQGSHVTVTDIRPESELDHEVCMELRDMGVNFETGGHRRETFLNAELIIISPAVPRDMDFLCDARKKGIPAIGELELAGRLIDTPIIAITGTNGKSTVTTFLGFMLEHAGFKVFVGGNIGTPLMSYVAGERDADYVIAEVSSFQLDTIELFCPLVSIVLNISPDHLDRYPDYETYVLSKLKIFENQRSGQYVILNDNDERLASVRPASGVSVLRYGLEKKQGRHACFEDDKVKARIDDMPYNYFSIDSFNLPGRHNLENLLSVVLVGLSLNIETAAIQEAIDEFRGLPDRLEYVAESKGVGFYNDSKATNVDAAVMAIMAFDCPIVLIAGGRHKGADYSPLVMAAVGRVKMAVLIGEARGLLAESFEGVIPYLMAEDMEEAVSTAFSCAVSGDTVLLAPACSSFDMFSDYSHRGRIFMAAVEELACV